LSRVIRDRWPAERAHEELVDAVAEAV
jgi:hypothetical protein